VFCPNLKSLTLLDNPINYDCVLQESETTADVQIRNRHIVSALIPQLEILDDIPLANIIKKISEIEQIKIPNEQQKIIQTEMTPETPIAPKKPIKVEIMVTPERPVVSEKLVRRRPVSVAMVKRPEPPTSSIISTKQISLLRARVQARLAEQPKKLLIDIPESDKQITLKTKIPMPPIKSSQSLHAFTAPVPPSTRRTQSFKYHSRVFTVASS
jgi:hypothetical protein